MSAISTYSRQVAGTYALRIAHNAGIELAAEYYKGVLAAFAVALVAVIGPEKTYQIFCDAIRFVPPRSAPKLVTNDGERVA